MNEDDRRFLRDWGDYIGDTLDKNYDLVEKLERVPICVACPMAQWYKLETPPPKPDAEPKAPTLECYCIVFRGVMYDGNKVVTACDARADALKPKDEPDAGGSA